MKLTNKDITAILVIFVGLLFIIMRNSMLSLVITLLGAALLVIGVLQLIKKETPVGIMLLVAGAFVIVFGNFFTSIALYVIAALLIIYCVMNLMIVWKRGEQLVTSSQKIHAYLKPVIGILAGVFLLFHQGGAVSWVFIVVGIILVAEGVLMLTERNSH